MYPLEVLWDVDGSPGEFDESRLDDPVHCRQVGCVQVPQNRRDSLSATKSRLNRPNQAEQMHFSTFVRLIGYSAWNLFILSIST